MRYRGFEPDKYAPAKLVGIVVGERGWLWARNAAHPVPFEWARTVLCEGEVLRRLRQLWLARSPPGAAGARSLLAELGVRPWAARAATELAAARDRSVAPGREAGSADAIRVADVGALSAQELQITASRRGGTTPRWQ